MAAGGVQRYGLVPGGAMDRLALASANILVGNAAFARGGRSRPVRRLLPLARDGAVRVALSGAPRNADIAKRQVAFDTSVTLADGESLTLGFARGGSFSYLAIEGGVQGEPMFGSLAVNARAGLGSPYPRPLQSGDELQVAAASGAAERRIELPVATDGPIRVVLGAAGRGIRRRSQAAVSGQRVENFSDQRSHGLPAGRSGDPASARSQHCFRRHRQR